MRSSCLPCLLTAKSHEVGSIGLSSSRWTHKETETQLPLSWLSWLQTLHSNGSGGWVGLRKDVEEDEEGP